MLAGGAVGAGEKEGERDFYIRTRTIYLREWYAQHITHIIGQGVTMFFGEYDKWSTYCRACSIGCIDSNHVSTITKQARDVIASGRGSRDGSTACVYIRAVIWGGSVPQYLITVHHCTRAGPGYRD